ncbi:class II histocompatibility antigen, B-L beta chain-like [Agelaius phoeniceus]|uniref:class II histocompatibility antigen, B-L beta chain-like n=1 Tax=Agelaius phoeniceus TaxID=39638 RepID=UPI0040551FDE
MHKYECQFINGTEKVRFVARYIYNRDQFLIFDSDVGVYVGFTHYGERWARDRNSDPEWMQKTRTAVDWLCRHNYDIYTKFTTVEQRGDRGVRWFQGQQELSEHVVATDVVPNGDWTYQLLVLLETPPRRGLTYSCQVEHVSLEQPLSRHWEMPPDAARSKMLTGIGGFVLGFVFLALGLGFYVRKKSS